MCCCRGCSLGYHLCCQSLLAALIAGSVLGVKCLLKEPTNEEERTTKERALESVKTLFETINLSPLGSY